MDTETYAKIHAAEDTLWFYLGRREIVRRVIETHGTLAVHRYLDVGCGSGGAMRELGREAGMIVGADVSPLALRYSREKGLRHLFEGDAQELPLAGESFELVTALDVIEHCRDDVMALREIYRVLAPGGLCCLTVPALMVLWSNLDLVNRHFRRYTVSEVRRKAEQVGFCVRKASYANTWLFPGVLAVRLLQRFTQSPDDGAATLDFAMPSQGINRLMTLIFTSESNWLARANLPIGSSVIAVLQKPVVSE
ncbi:MAG: class I SAM-dependent methyltransferase [Chloroflexi bacterium]|nr:class I SAM-dependent methyltransferase [Chloroflexota bacterium]